MRSSDGTERFDMFSPCPGCGHVGFAIEVYERVGDTEVQFMACSKSTGECRVSEYYPRPVGGDSA